MLRGMKVLITALFSVFFLKRKLYRHHWTSVAVIFIGLVLVGVAVLTGNNTTGITSSPLGVVILLLATIFSSCLYVVEEKLLG